MTRHSNQRSGYEVPTQSHERDISAGRYHVEKWNGERWVLMSAGDVDPDAPPGRELDRLVQRAHVLEGKTRIVRKRGSKVVWESDGRDHHLEIDST